MSELAKVEPAAVPATTPTQLLEIAVQQNADIDKLTKLMDLQDRWEANEAKKAYVQAMAKFRDACPAIEKTRKAYDSKYAGLAETLQIIKGAMSDHGLSHTWKTSQDNGLITVTCCVTHIQGHSECTSLSGAPDSTGSKNAIQAVGSTVSYLERYTLFALLGLASKDQDDDGAGGDKPRISDQQAADIRALIEETGADESKFLRWLKVDSVEGIPAQAYDQAVKALERKRQ